MPYRIGVDVGGTFTDATVIDDSGQIRIAKSSTTPKNIPEGIFRALTKCANQFDQSLKDFLGDASLFVHGTTVATNTLLEHKGAKTGLITTQGFRDTLELKRAHKPDLWNIHIKKTEELIPRYLRLGVKERINAQGKVITPLDEETVYQAINALVADNVEAIAICTLFSFLNPIHEKRIKEMVNEVAPDVYCCTSSEVLPQIREFERFSACTVNATLMPIITKYIDDLTNNLRENGLNLTPYMMQSNGGLMSFGVAKLKPIHIIESGPAAGVIGAAFLGSMLSTENLISFDMGGTTAKAGLIRQGRPEITSEYEVGGEVHTVSLTKRGGYPINIPVIDLSEVGAGGGSIAWIDKGGALQVGPKSAGAEPGPVCYDLGGTEPTVTDADLLLGLLNKDFFLGGEMQLKIEKSEETMRRVIAEPLGLTPIEAAKGIFEVINANMADVLRVATIQKGYDPREFGMAAFGGAGAVHAAVLAQDLNIPKVIVPKTASAFSALGMIETDLKHDFVRTYRGILSDLDSKDLTRNFNELKSEGLDILSQEGTKPDSVDTIYILDMRYIGQHHEVGVDIAEADFDPNNLDRIAKLFHARHEALYAYSEPEIPIEVVNLHVTVIGRLARVNLPKWGQKTTDYSLAKKGPRKVFLPGDDKPSSVATYDGEQLHPGALVPGPAIIEERTTTIFIPKGMQGTVDLLRNMVITSEG